MPLKYCQKKVNATFSLKTWEIKVSAILNQTALYCQVIVLLTSLIPPNWPSHSYLTPPAYLGGGGVNTIKTKS